MSSRKETADALKKAACSYFSRKLFSCHLEIGIEKWGKFKADVLAVNMRAELILCEIKSCVADFTADDKHGKWQNYLMACNKFYWVFTESTAEKLRPHFKRLREHGCGVLVLDSTTGYLRSVQPAKRRPMKGKLKREVVTRLAWRNGDVSRRTSRCRVRVFLGDNK